MQLLDKFSLLCDPLKDAVVPYHWVAHYATRRLGR